MTNVYLIAHSRLCLADQARRTWKTGYALGTAETIWFELLTLNRKWNESSGGRGR